MHNRVEFKVYSDYALFSASEQTQYSTEIADWIGFNANCFDAASADREISHVSLLRRTLGSIPFRANGYHKIGSVPFQSMTAFFHL